MTGLQSRSTAHISLFEETHISASRAKTTNFHTSGPPLLLWSIEFTNFLRKPYSTPLSETHSRVLWVTKHKDQKKKSQICDDWWLATFETGLICLFATNWAGFLSSQTCCRFILIEQDWENVNWHFTVNTNTHSFQWQGLQCGPTGFEFHWL